MRITKIAVFPLIAGIFMMFLGCSQQAAQTIKTSSTSSASTSSRLERSNVSSSTQAAPKKENSTLTKLKAEIAPYPEGCKRMKVLLGFVENNSDSIKAVSTDEVYAYAMDELGRCLSTQEARKYPSLEYEKISSQLGVFEATTSCKYDNPQDRIAQYKPDAKVYGKGSEYYLFFVPAASSGSKEFIVRGGSTKYLQSLSILGSNDFIAVSNDTDSGSVFIENLKISNGKAKFLPAVTDFQKGLWKANASNGQVVYTGSGGCSYTTINSSNQIIITANKDNAKTLTLIQKAGSKIYTPKG